MKKNLLLIILPIIMSIGLTIQSTAQGEFYGKWVLPIIENGSSNNHQTLILSFFGNQISDITVSNPISEKVYCQIAAGAYNPNYDLDFYINDNTLLYDLGNQSFIWDVSAEYYVREEIFKPEFQIIPKPGDIESYFMFYSEKDHDKTLSTYFCYSEIWYENGWHVSGNNIIIPGNEVNSSLSFAISDEDDDKRKLYTSSVPMDNSTPEFPAGLRKWEIDQSGVGEMTEIVMAANSLFEIDDFSAHNLELKTENNGDDVTAWISTNPLSLEKVFIVTDGNEEDYDLGFGRIGGIEFSSLDPNVLYVSCPEEGIMKMDYTNGNYISTLVDSENFGHTFLQTAPDGHIYAMLDDGSKLGQINMQTGIFHPDYYSVPDSTYIVSAYRLFDNTKYFILPENDREYCPLSATVELQHVCPGQCTGEAWIDEDSIICGHDPYTYTWYNNDNQVIGNINHIYDLCEGSYRVEMQDFYDLIFEEEFVITVDTNYYDYDWYIVNENEDWPDFELSFLHGIRIKAGVKLELINSHLKFLKPAKIIVEQGARLIVDHSTLSYYPECDDKWQGIEVLGDGTQHQYTINGICYQGYLELKNNSEVSYSENAVSLYKTTIDSINIKRIINWDSCGGIVRSTNTNFLNNTRAVHFIPYSNFNPYQVDMQMDNLSHFIKDTFDIKLNNIGDSIFYKHADLHGVKGINFHGCTFTNSDTNFVSQWNLGIAAYGAGFEVKSVCTEPMVPCPPQYTIPSSFNGFYWGIGAYGSADNIHTFRVRDAKLENNVVGIYDSEVNYAVMVNNEFNIGYNASDGSNCDNVSSFGIDVHSANGFAIENNYFTKALGAPTGNYVGVRLDDTRSVDDDIYLNEFIGLSVGNLSERRNRPNIYNDKLGIAYVCNDNFNNNYDFHVADDSYIRGKMGSLDMPSGNKLSQNAVLQFRNDYTQEIQYYHYKYDPLQILTLFSNYVDTFSVVLENTCPDHYGGGGGINVVLNSTQKAEKQQVFDQNMADYTLTLDLYETLKDGGDTPLMENEIETAWPDQMWELRAQLLANSPHLSFEVLKDVADRTDVFPESVQFDIFAANPDEMRNDNFLLYLETKAQPMPQYMIDMLRQIGYGTSYKTVLQNLISDYYANAIHAAQDILRSKLFDSIPDLNEVRLWLGNIGGYQADKQIIATYLQEQDYTAAQSLLNALPGTYSLTGDDLLAYNDYESMIQLQINLMQAGRTVFDLDSAELASVSNIADFGYGSAVQQARNILEYAYGYHYYKCPSLPDSLTLKRHHALITFNQHEAIQISVKPNPANTWVAFDYTLPFNVTEGTIRIMDIAGQAIEIIRIHETTGQKVLDTRHIPAGVYIYKIESAGYSASGKLIIN